MSYLITSSATDPATSEPLTGFLFHIDSISRDRLGGNITATCGIYASGAALAEGKAPIATYSYSFTSLPNAPATTASVLAATVASTQSDPEAAALYTLLVSHPAAAALLAGATVYDNLST